MSRFVVVKLGDVDYSVPHLNLEQLERVTDALSSLPSLNRGFAVLRIALERSTPQSDPKTIEPEPEQVRDAVKAILIGSGLAKDEVPVPGEDQPTMETSGTPSSAS